MNQELKFGDEKLIKWQREFQQFLDGEFVIDGLEELFYRGDEGLKVDEDLWLADNTRLYFECIKCKKALFFVKPYNFLFHYHSLVKPYLNIECEDCRIEYRHNDIELVIEYAGVPCD